MRLVTSVIALSFLPALLCSQPASGRFALNDNPGESAYAPEGAITSPTLENALLDSIFSPHPVPPAGIPVLDHALGDIIRDSSINIRDLLRLRDITIGRGPSATPYEISKSDINRDNHIDAADVGVLRDILLRIQSVPYLIDSTGGWVSGDGIIIVIPPGAVDSTIVISVRGESETEFGLLFGIDTKAARQDSAFFMKAFEMKSSVPDFARPVDVIIKLDSVPPCAYQGLNGLFAAVPDRDGDGRTELFLINELHLGEDSLTLATRNITIPTIQVVSPSQLEPGEQLTIHGSGYGADAQSVAARFTSEAYPDTFQDAAPSSLDDTTIVLVVPPLSAGLYLLTVNNVLTGLQSNAQPVTILPHQPVVGDVRSIIVSFFVKLAATLDSLKVDSLVGTVADSSIARYYTSLYQNNRLSLDSEITFFESLDDSLVTSFEPLASYILNLSDIAAIDYVRVAREFNKARRDGFCDGIGKAWRQVGNWLGVSNFLAKKWRTVQQWGQGIDDIGIGLKNLLNRCWCTAEGVCSCGDVTFVGIGPKNQRVSGGYGPGGFSTHGCCINIIRYQRNQCATVGGSEQAAGSYPQHQGPMMISDNHDPDLSRLASPFPLAPRPHPGSIIKVTNAPVPYNIAGIVNDNGRAFIPHVPMNTQVTFSLYDPITGFYDPAVGTYVTGSTPGGFDFPLLLFRPNTQIRSYPIMIGDVKNDSVTMNMQRVDYLLKIEPTDTTSLLNFGFGASTLLSLKIDDPQGESIFASLDVVCQTIVHMRLAKVGYYRIRVAIGINGEPGSFNLGLTYSPNPPLPSSCLCGSVSVDTLFQELSPYMVKCQANIPANDTLTCEAGVSFEFNQGGIVTADGVLAGIGTSVKPIKLKPAELLAREPAKLRKPVLVRKEVRP